MESGNIDAGDICLTIPDDIDRLAVLQTLVVSRNDLEEVPQSLGNLTGLKKLFLSKNELTGLPASLTRCTQLKMVDLKGNPITPDTVSQLEQMFGDLGHEVTTSFFGSVIGSRSLAQIFNIGILNRP